jgi:hypothetical protein
MLLELAFEFERVEVDQLHLTSRDFAADDDEVRSRRRALDNVRP